MPKSDLVATMSSSLFYCSVEIQVDIWIASVSSKTACQCKGGASNRPIWEANMPGRSTERSCALLKSPSGSCRGCKTAGNTTSVSFAPALQAQVLSCLQELWGLLHGSRGGTPRLYCMRSKHCLRHMDGCTSTPVALCRQVKPSEWWDQIPSGACRMHWRSTEGVSLQLNFRMLCAGASGVSPPLTCRYAHSSNECPRI